MTTIKLLFLIIGFCLTATLQAQKLITSSGATVSNSQYTIEYSIGEIAITTVKDGNDAVSQGLLQPQVFVAEENCLILSYNLSIYPNPVSNVIYFTGISQFANSCQIFTAEGKIVKSFSLFNNKIDISSLANGVYFIRFLPACNGKYKVQKIVKI